MDEAERIAREAYGTEFNYEWNPNAKNCEQRAVLLAARLGIEHGERESAAKIADMKATLHWYALRGNSRATECLARNFPATKPSLREAQEMACKAVLSYEEWIKSGLHLLGSTRRAHVDALEAAHALRDALAREEGK